MTLLDFQLRTLEYPHSVDLTQTESIRQLVVWLENKKIREYKIADRKALNDTQSPSWDAAFKKYLGDLECPLPPPAGGSPPALLAALQWLLAYALHLEYEDNADKIAAAAAGAAGAASAGGSSAPVPAGPPAASGQLAPASAGQAKKDGAGGGTAGGRAAGAVSDAPFCDLADPATLSALQQLLRITGVAPAGAAAAGGADAASGAFVDQLLAAAELLVCSVGPVLQAGGGGGGGMWDAGKPPRQALARVPLGFEVEGEALSSAAAALRLLYMRDLRRLQSQIDHALVEMQEYTANPRTDASLGKVGR
ncbi:hypothetical protein Agub_g5408 [Astrephomene gubernaculifera]|uniref:Uncharacterized protein n=1 Tax=Astrephomene gubernaculifera TaxID=47775 RepID=A0AAD3DLT1_9CHLO|nr:hypothetical protein Agub_g5408 [Astrephomene gubernaculifera]